MTIPVPTAFANAIRQQRLVMLSVVSALSFAAALFVDHRAVYAGIAAVAAILVIFLTYNLPLMYRVSDHGTYLTTSIPSLALPLSLAINFWLAWPFSSVVDVRHTHYQQLPALLIRTRVQRYGSILPIDRDDADSLASYLRSLATQRGANAYP